MRSDTSQAQQHASLVSSRDMAFFCFSFNPYCLRSATSPRVCAISIFHRVTVVCDAFSPSNRSAAHADSSELGREEPCTSRHSKGQYFSGKPPLLTLPLPLASPAPLLPSVAAGVAAASAASAPAAAAAAATVVPVSADSVSADSVSADSVSADSTIAPCSPSPSPSAAATAATGDAPSSSSWKAARSCRVDGWSAHGGKLPVGAPECLTSSPSTASITSLVCVYMCNECNDVQSHTTGEGNAGTRRTGRARVSE